MTKIVILSLIAVIALIGVGKTLPDLIRYMRIRSM
jgi:hypothetical protein